MKYITPNPVEATFMKWIFQTIAEGTFASDQIRKMANEKGFMISRANFYREIRNPVYCGKIVVKTYKDKEEQWVDGLHEPIISEGLLRRVQDVLEGHRGLLLPQSVKLYKYLPLKGLLECSKCERNLTGSASKGRNCLYYCYHGQNTYGCGCWYKADLLNEEMEEFINKFVPKKVWWNFIMKWQWTYTKKTRVQTMLDKKKFRKKLKH